MIERVRKIFLRCETALIVLLFFSAMYLLFRAMAGDAQNYFDRFLSVSTDEAVGDVTSSQGIIPSCPFAIVLTGDDGEHSGAKYDRETKQRVFALFSATLGETLGSFGEMGQIRERDWLNALERQGVFFDYLYPLPLDLLAAHLGSGLSAYGDGDISVRRFILGEQDGQLCLYFKDEESSFYYRAKTALSFSSLNLGQRIDDLGLLPCGFAFQEEDAGMLDPCFVFSGEELAPVDLTAAVPLGPEDVYSSLSSFHMNAGAASVYNEQDGLQVYVEGGKSIRVSGSGFMLFTVTGTGGIPVGGNGEPSLDECVYAAGQLVRSTLGIFCGAAETGLIDIESSDTGSGYTLTFGYYVNGVPVRLQDTGWCARIKVSGNYIVRAELYFRSYEPKSSSLSPLPERQAAVLASKDGGEPLLVYDDGENIGWSWILR